MGEEAPTGRHRGSVEVYGREMSSPVVTCITSKGGIILPVALVRRWDAELVLTIDRGDHAIVRPVPTDPMEALRGSSTGSGPSSDEIRAQEREDDAERDARRDGSV